MHPSLWGTSLWDSIHNIAAGFPDNPTKKQIKAYCIFYKALGKVIPCNSCAVSYRKFIREKPIHKYLTSKKRLLYWTYLIHNKVNKKLKKKIRISWGNVYKKYIKVSVYHSMKQKCDQKNI